MSAALRFMDGVTRTVNRPSSVSAIQSAVARKFDIDVAALSAKGQSRDVVVLRQIAMWLARKATHRSFPEIGRLFGNRHHTTVMHAIELVERRIQEFPDFADEMRVMLLAFLPAERVS